jgi:ketosteroid isomerase-like protein
MREPTLTGLLVLVLTGVTPAANAQTTDHQAVVATIRTLHEALARGDSVGALRLLAPDALILEAGGLETREDYRGHHLPGDIAFAGAVPSQRAEPTVVVSGDVAWVVGTSRTTGTFRELSINSAGAELAVLGRTAEGWVIRAIHWSSRPIRTP